MVANGYISRNCRAGENRGEPEQFSVQETETEVQRRGLRGEQIHQKRSTVGSEWVVVVLLFSSVIVIN